MFGVIKSLLFKNKDTIAKTIWEHLGLPINAVRLKSDHKDFVHEFSEDKYLSYFFNTYQQLMLEHFFNVKGNVNQGRIIQKIMRLFDPRFEKDGGFAIKNARVREWKEQKSLGKATKPKFRPNSRIFSRGNQKDTPRGKCLSWNEHRIKVKIKNTLS